jgi:Flp pilus assembly pilin Flp
MLKRFVQNEIGVESAEYAMILAFICIALIIAVMALAVKIQDRFNNTADTINTLP